jgi:hypothetical protein
MRRLQFDALRERACLVDEWGEVERVVGVEAEPANFRTHAVGTVL